MSTPSLYIVQLAGNIPLSSAHSGLFFSMPLGEAVTQALLCSMVVLSWWFCLQSLSTLLCLRRRARGYRKGYLDSFLRAVQVFPK